MWATYIADTVAPPWLQGTWGRRWLTSLAADKDVLVEQMEQAVLARCPSWCPADALALIGADRQIERQLDDSDDTYRAKLLAAFDTWRWSGTLVGVLNAMVALGCTCKYAQTEPITGAYFRDPGDTILAMTARDWGTQTPDGDAPEPRWARFWLFVDYRKVFGAKPFTLQFAQGMIRVVQKWKGAHCKGRIAFMRDGYIRGPHETRGPHRRRGGRIMGAYDC